MYVALSNASSSDNSCAKETRKELRHDALQSLSWHYRKDVIVWHPNMIFKISDLIRNRRSRISSQELKACRINCKRGGHYLARLRIHSIPARGESKHSHQFVDNVISPQTCELVSQYFTRLKTLSLDCGLEKKGLKNLCLGRLNCLQTLELNDCRWLSDKSLKPLKGLPVKRMKFNRSHSINQGLLYLRNSSTLRKLNIEGFTAVTNKVVLKLITGLAYQLNTFRLDDKSRVVLDSNLETQISRFLQENKTNKVVIAGTTVAD